jgi:hypothetical protein
MNTSGIMKGGIVAALFLFVSSYLRSLLFHSGHDHGIAFPSLADHWAEHGGGGGSGAMVAWILYFVVAGLVVAWLYALARSRHGAGPKTGLIAGLVVVVIAVVLPLLASISVGRPVGGGEGGMTTVLWVIVEMVLAGVVAGKLYTED